MNFLNNLKLLMETNKITQKELAKALEISPSTITMWFTRGCDNINISTLMKLSKYFNVSMEELVNGNQDKRIITFTENDYTNNELNAIINFSEFLKSSRRDRCEIAEELIDIDKINNLKRNDDKNESSNLHKKIERR